MTSVNTNYGALVALQSLNRTTSELSEVQQRINTGLKVSSAKDNGAVFAIAEGQRARVASLGAVADGIDRATSVIDVGLSAGEAIGDILKQLKDKAVAAQANDLSQDQRDALQADFDALRDQVDQIANAATFNGSNLVNGTNLTGGSSAFSVLTSDIGGTSGSYELVNSAFATLYSSTATIETANGALTVGANDELAFTITNGNETTTFTVDVDATDTIQQFVDKVGTASGGRVTATYDDTTGAITYHSSEDFTVTYEDGAGAGVDDDGFFDDTDGATGKSFDVVAAPGAGSNELTVSGFDFRLGTAGQALAGFTSSLDISTASGAATASDAIDTALTNLNKDMATLGAQAKALDVQKSFLGKLTDSIEAGIGNLVDADLAKESARLQALQVKQQLGAQALSIANSAPSIVLSFFR
ncbi:MAG TPA: flagellin [Vitreimonas sp.]|uniref:flagellin n=1 Tax=Vitreimonas sp. TaxID=3069702 RepID=UPI002D6C1C10|nr:flagellin [Vitreimonas sp.]HYD88262.1 flagellin [Vitreimonas sp.]